MALEKLSTAHLHSTHHCLSFVPLSRFPRRLSRLPSHTTAARSSHGRFLRSMLQTEAKDCAIDQNLDSYAYRNRLCSSKQDLCSFAAEKNEVVRSDFLDLEQAQRLSLDVLLATLTGLPMFMGFANAARADTSGQSDMIYGEIGAGIESGVQLLYLAALLGLVGVGSFFVVRQILIRRELESAAKDLQERVRTGEALPMEYFELGAVMLRKKFFLPATKYLQQAIDKWDGDPQDLAQVHNALGFCFVSDEKIDKGIEEYKKAVKLQPGYVVAWNNLGNAYQKKKDLTNALKAYEQALFFDPNNKVAREYRDTLKTRVDRLAGVTIKTD